MLGALRFTTERFSQLLGQLGEFLDHLKVASSEVDGDYRTRVSLAQGALTRARDDAATLAAALETAWPHLVNSDGASVNAPRPLMDVR